MKKFTRNLFGAILIGLLGISQSANSTIWIVNTSDFVFTPDILTEVHIGDTVRWVWVSGIHTTTSSTIPVGAQTWDSPMTSEVTVFDYVPTIAGTYNYVCTPHAEFGMVGSFTVIGASAIPELTVKPVAVLVPNPFRDRVAIQFKGQQQEYKELKVFDENGKMVRNYSFVSGAAVQSKEINIGELTSGIYFFELLDENNKAYFLKGIRE